MKGNFFEDNFDYQAYLQERLMEIQNLQERKDVKQVMEKTLLPFYKEIETAYQRLEERLFFEEQERVAPCRIITGIKERKRIDETDFDMVPMCVEDLQERIISVARLWESLETGRDYDVYTVYLHTDYLKLKNLSNSVRVFRGTVRTEYGEYQADFKVRPCKKYLDILHGLYREFINNGIPWRTVCAPYLYKMFDVSMTDTNCPKDEAVTEISVDFEEFSEYVRYQYVPMWNVRTVERKTSSYPQFCLDRVHYLHCIYETKLDLHKDYIVAGEIPLWDVSRIQGELRISCDEKSPANWTLREFSYRAIEKDREWPAFHNGGTIEQLPIHTVAETKRFVNQLGYQAYMLLADIKTGAGESREETYDTDSFLMDEIRQSRDGKKLDFIFQPTDRENIWNYDVMSYIVGRLQLLYPEYHCRGQLK